MPSAASARPRDDRTHGCTFVANLNYFEECAALDLLAACALGQRMRQPLLLLHAGWLPPMVAARLLLLAAPLAVVASAATAGGDSPLVESELLLAATLLSPTSDAVVFCTRSGATPRFSWDAGQVPTAVAGLPDTMIEISSSPDFSAAGFLCDEEGWPCSRKSKVNL